MADVEDSSLEEELKINYGDGDRQQYQPANEFAFYDLLQAAVYTFAALVLFVTCVKQWDVFRHMIVQVFSWLP